MILTELNPKWVMDDTSGLDMLWFDCPAHPESKINGESTDWVSIRVSDDPSVQRWRDYPVWTRIGIDFRTLTIKPSIDMRGHWHGFVTNGEIITV
jgi:hypothetical protein